MDFYSLIMEGEAAGVGDFLDNQMASKNSVIPKFYNKKYGYGFHASVALLRTGTMPNHDRVFCKEIIKEVEEGLGLTISLSYITSFITTRLKNSYGLDFSNIKRKRGPYRNEQPRTHAPRVIKDPEAEGVCMSCLLRFTIDRKNHPTNLCICTECAPGGIRYSESVSTGASVFSNAGYRNPKKGATA